MGRAGEPPPVPLNLIGDFGGGGMLLAFGIACALVEAKTSGQGQVVDAAMVDGSALLMTFIHGLKAMGVWSGPRGTNLLDSGAPFYDVYECADGEYVSVGSIEPQFYAELVRLSGMDHEPHQMARDDWPAMRDELTRVFKAKTRDEWCQVMEASDVCFAPVLSMDEAPHHPHNVARETFVEVAGIQNPNAAPRFSRTPGAIAGPPAHAGQHTDDVLAEIGLTPDDIAALRESGAVA
jgi:alpha-methylacyl-CoA racemase